MRILVVEDEQDLASAIADSLRRDGYAIDIAPTASSAMSLTSVNSYDVVCLDLNLPDGDGLDVCRQVLADPARSYDLAPAPKILMLTARGGVDDRIRGLDEGADDYLVKPFSLGELSARIRALLRRDTSTGSSVIAYAGIEMDTARHEVTFHGEPYALTVKEYALLRWFLLHPEEVHSAERLLEHVWDEHADPFTNTVRMTLSNLRRKLSSVVGGAADRDPSRTWLHVEGRFMSGSRVRLAIVLMAPAVLMAFVVMVVTVALLVSHEPWADARTGIAQVGDDLVVVVAEEGSLDGLIDSGLLAPALALIPALVVAWVVAGRVRRVVAQARAEVEAAEVERRSRTQEVVHELRTPLAVMGTNLELAGNRGRARARSSRVHRRRPPGGQQDDANR